MPNGRTARRVALVAALSLLAAHPGPARARPGPVRRHVDSKVGVALAAICGASINIARVAPVPIVVVVGGAACFFALVDAMITPDRDGR